MPNRRFPTQTYSSDQQAPSRNAEWDALKGELEGLLDHVHGQIAEYEHKQQREVREDHLEPVRRYGTDDGAQHFMQQAPSPQEMNDQDLRRQDALRQVQSAVARMDRKQNMQPASMRHDDGESGNARLDRAVAQIRARQDQIRPNIRRQDNEPRLNGPAPQQKERELAPIDPPAYVHEIMQGMEGLHRSVRDLANQSLKQDPQHYSANFNQIEKRISALGDLIQRHSDPALDDVGARLDDLMNSTQRLAEIQIKQLAQLEEFRENSQSPAINIEGLENGIHNLYERLDALERTAGAPPKELDTIARSVAGIASAVGHLQDESMAQKLPEIYAQLQEIGERISTLDDKHSTRVTDHIRREMQGVRSEVTGALEPRFDSIEARLEGLQENLIQPTLEVAQPDLSELHAIEQRLNDAISSLDSVRDASTASLTPQNNEDVLSALTSMEDRLNAAIDSIDRAQQDRSAPADNFYRSLKGMEDRIIDAIQSLQGAHEPPQTQDAPAIDLEGLKAIEAGLTAQLEALDAKLQTMSAPAAKPAHAEALAELPSNDPACQLAAWDAAAEADAPAPHAANIEPSHNETAVAPSFEEAIGSAPTDEDQGSDAPVGLGFADIAADEETHDTAERSDGYTEASAAELTSPETAAPHYEPPVLKDQDTHVPTPADAPVEDTPATSAQEDVPRPRSAFDTETTGYDDGPRSLSDLYDGNAPAPSASDTANSASFGSEGMASQPHSSTAADRPEGQAQDDTLHQARQSFIAAARSAAVAKNDPQEQATSLLGRAFARIKAGKDEKETSQSAEPTIERPAAAPLNGSKNHLHEASENLQDDVEEMEVAAEQRRKRFMMPFTGKKKDEEAAPAPEAEKIERPKSAFDDEHQISLDGHPDHRDALDETAPDEEEAQESFLSRHRQPILLGASIVAIIAMTVNLINQNSSDKNAATTGAAPSISEPADADVSALGDASAPRQIDMTQSPAIEIGELAALTDQNTLADQDVGLVPPHADGVDSDLTTASISPEPIKTEQEELVPEVGPEGLRMAAAGGDVRAQFEMGAILMEGQVVPKDSQAASKWFEQAAAAGYAPAQYRLAAAFEHGIGVKQNIDQAKEWYKRAAENGNRMAMHNLAALFASADANQQDFSKASVWFERAANQGVVDSQFNLGMLYARGLGVEQDLGKSYFWFALAALQGDQDAKGARDDVARSIDAAQMQDLKDRVANWQPEKVALGANYAPIGTWDPAFDPGPAIEKKEVVLGVQTALLKLGFSVGQPDGMMGPKTEDAIRGFERALGMNESGAINPRLMAILSSQPI
ncbi:peptidoglycan-binding protein [Maritalea mediterranea]|uniref:Peptidoglycan-binding protein n=1 Tax=Maritalea mediterranea TaxID=2909667 RepID=A0ABS9E455_9HYPH|nr:peptidoglycan-binding protein [Maritalea mediterranea]MCF4097658.1 peptidoglycan-binding protein [Maritalea mediterranea]